MIIAIIISIRREQWDKIIVTAGSSCDADRAYFKRFWSRIILIAVFRNSYYCFVFIIKGKYKSIRKNDLIFSGTELIIVISKTLFNNKNEMVVWRRRHFSVLCIVTKNKTLSLVVTYGTEWISRSSIFTSANIWKLWLIINDHQTTISFITSTCLLPSNNLLTIRIGIWSVVCMNEFYSVTYFHFFFHQGNTPTSSISKPLRMLKS